jgi:hypothetical protein
MENDEDKDYVEVDADEIISPHWNEHYVDGASITNDGYAIRIAFVNHFPLNSSSKRQVKIYRKVDVVMSNIAFDSLYEAMKGLVDKREQREKITKSNVQE